MSLEVEKVGATRPIAIDLFAGAGGLSLGFEEAGFDVSASVEFDPVHAAVHSYNFPYSKMFCADIRTVTARQLREGSSIGIKDVDVVFGGPPCQGISLMGKRNIDDPRNNLLGEFVRLVLEISPKYFVMENVAGLAVGNYRELLATTVQRLEAGGYRVLPYRVLQAADYGVPQSRKRLILLGYRQGEHQLAYPEPSVTSRKRDGERVEGALPIGPSVADALFDLPDADHYEELLDSDKVLVDFGCASEYAKRLHDTSSDPENYSYQRPYDPRLLSSSARTVHRQKSIDRFMKTSPGETEPISRFFRLHPDGISNTLRAGTASDRGAYTAPRPIHPLYPRVITVREAARLHGYPDWFRFHVTKWNGFREVGNSVPVFLARAVASEVMDALGCVPAKGSKIELGDERLLCFSQSEAREYFGIANRVIPQRRRKDKVGAA